MKWNKEDEEFLIKNYSTMDNKSLSKKLNRTEISLRHKAQKLNLKKTEEYINSYKKNPKIKYNYIDFSLEELKTIALKYKTKTEFSIENKTAYQKARRLGSENFNYICSHMINQNFSLPQLILKFMLNKLLKAQCEYNTRNVITPYELDLYYKRFNLAFEYDGKKWHLNNKNDKIKNDLCKHKNITLIRIIEKNKDNPFEDVLYQIIDNIDIINKATNKQYTEKDVLAIELNNKEIFSEILDEDSIKKTISKYTFYKEFRTKENALYMKLKKRKLLEIYTSKLIRDKKDKYRNKNL